MTEYIIDWDENLVIDTFSKNSLCEEIIRCRDCYFGKEVHRPADSTTPSDWLDCVGPMVETWDYWNDEPQDNPVPPDGFCAWAERRDGGLDA